MSGQAGLLPPPKKDAGGNGGTEPGRLMAWEPNDRLTIVRQATQLFGVFCFAIDFNQVDLTGR